MSFHALTLALRSLRRDLPSAALGGVSLAVAFAACVLIALFVREELSYNRGLPNAERVSILATETTFAGETDAIQSTPSALAPALRQSVPAVEAATLARGRGGMTPVLAPGEDLEVGFMFGDASFFDVFAYPFLEGDRATALDRPDGAVLTTSAAQRLFGTTEALGRTFTVVPNDTVSFVVRGVIADLPEPSTLTFEVVGSLDAWLARRSDTTPNWGQIMYQTYALRRAEASEEAFLTALDEIGGDDVPEFASFFTVPLTEHRFSEIAPAVEGFGGDLVFVRLFSAVAVLILVLGGINYVNLATARGARRAREIGVRKALGSGRGVLVGQFLTESVVLSVLAGVAGVGLAALALPFFNTTFGVDLALADLDVVFLGGLGLAATGVGAVAGLYPAVYLSRFEPTRVLRGVAAPAQAAGEAFLARTWLRRGLVVFQFVAAVLLLAGTGAVLQQLDYHRSKPLGLDPEGLVAVRLTDRALAERAEVVKRAFRQTPGVVGVAGTSDPPPRILGGVSLPPDPEREDLVINFQATDVDADFARVVGLELAAGRWIKDTPADAARAVVVNEAFADALGWTPAEAVGREVATGMEESMQVVGVVRDYHYESLRQPVEAVVLGPAREDGLGNFAGDGTSYPDLVVRLAPGDAEAHLDALRATWARLAGDAPFEVAWVADEYAHLASSEVRLAQTLGLFALVAAFIAALGLAGLAAYTAERRMREVGIRKVLGAGVGQLVGLLSREYVALAAVAAAIALPLGVVLVRRWHEGFAYHAPLDPALFAGAAVGALVLAVASVGAQAYRAARRDPAQTLRTE